MSVIEAGATYVNESFLVQHVPGDTGWGELQAIDVATGKRMWHKDTRLPWNDGTLSTDGGLVFSGTPDGTFFAFDARSGRRRAVPILSDAGWRFARLSDLGRCPNAGIAVWRCDYYCFRNLPRPPRTPCQPHNGARRIITAL